MSRERCTRRSAVLLALALVSGLTGATALEAQAPDLEIGVWGGPAFPVADLGKVTGTGIVVGAGIAYPLTPTFRLRTDVAFFERPGVGAGDERPVDVYERFITLGGDVELTPGTSPWGLAAQLGAGVSILSSDPVTVPGSRLGFVQLAEEKFAAYAGLEARYELSSDVIPFLRARGALSTAGRSMAVLRFVDPAVGESGPFVSLPIEAGVTIAF